MKKLTIISTISLIFLLSGCGGGASEIEAKEAKKYVGWTKNVTGIVAGVKKSTPKYKDPNYINLSKDYPHQDLTIVVYGDFAKKFDIDIESLKGKKIAVKGKIEWHRGNLQIRNPLSIRIVPN